LDVGKVGYFVFEEEVLDKIKIALGGVFAAALVFCPDPNRDPNAEKSGGIIRAGNDEAAKFSEQKGAKMP